jgi:hypothetical protein
LKKPRLIERGFLFTKRTFLLQKGTFKKRKQSFEKAKQPTRARMQQSFSQHSCAGNHIK